MAVGNGYSAGNLEFQIQAMEKNTTATFSKLNSTLMTMMNLIGHNTSNLKALQKTLTSISRIQFNSLDRLAQGLNKLNAINLQGLYQKINSLGRILTPLGNLSSSFSGLSSFNSFVNSIGKMSKIDIRSFYQEINSLTRTLKPLLEQLTVATPALTAFSNAMASVKGRRTINFSQFEGGGSGSSGKKGLSAFKLSNLFNKIYFIRNYTKQMFRSLTGIVQKAVEYTETLNLWQVAMRGNTQEAEEFIATMNKGYGIATQTLMQYQAIFKNMLSSLGGLTSDTSYALSEYLTQMAIDYASLYNVSIERAMTTFQSVLSGQVRPIRSIAGYDITETTIYQLYQQLGGTKTMRQLSQTEKRLLRIYAVFQQMESSGAIGDLNKTLGSTANQWRIFTEATKELGTWLGIIFEDIFKPILPTLNAIVITLTNITKAIAQMRGAKPQEFGIIESVEELNEQLDETQGKLLDFDKFSVLGQGGAEENALGIDTSLLAGLSKYESILSNITGEAQELAEKWTAWWVDADTGELTTQARILLGVLNAIGGVLLTLIGLNLAKKLGVLALKLIGLKNTNIIGWLQNIQLQGALATTRMQKLSVAFDYLKVSVSLAVLSFTLFDSVIGMLEGTAKKTVSIISIVIGALGTVLGLILAIKGGLKGGLLGASIAGLSVGALIAGIKGVSQSNADIQVRRTGGLVEDGLFTMNKGEVMGTFDDGTSIVANNQQIIEGIKQGVYTAVRAAMGSGSSGDIVLKVDSKEIARATVGATANALSKNYRVDFQPR